MSYYSTQLIISLYILISIIFRSIFKNLTSVFYVYLIVFLIITYQVFLSVLCKKSYKKTKSKYSFKIDEEGIFLLINEIKEEYKWNDIYMTIYIKFAITIFINKTIECVIPKNKLNNNDLHIIENNN